MSYLYLDIETLDFFQDEHIKALPRDEQLAAMRFGCAVTHRTDIGSWADWRAEHILNLYDLLVWCDLPVVGWNIADFDWPIIIHNARRSGHNPLEIETETVAITDLFAMVRQATGRWYSLEAVAQANLTRGKLADGQRAAEWLRSDDPALHAKALAYCRHDVKLTIDLHAILLRGEPLRLPPRAKRRELSEVLWWFDGRTEWLPDASGAVSTR